MLEHKEKEIHARTPTARNSETAGGNPVLTPSSVSDGLQVLRFHIERLSQDVGYRKRTICDNEAST